MSRRKEPKPGPASRFKAGDLVWYYRRSNSRSAWDMTKREAVVTKPCQSKVWVSYRDAREPCVEFEKLVEVESLEMRA